MSNHKENQKTFENGNEIITTIAQALNKEYIAPDTLAFDAWVNSTADTTFMRLPKNDGGTIVAKFSKDKSKKKLVRRTFEDKKTGERRESIRAEYMVVELNSTSNQSEDERDNEKTLEVPKTLAFQIEKNLEKNHLVLEITRSGTGLNTRYTVIAA